MVVNSNYQIERVVFINFPGFRSMHDSNHIFQYGMHMIYGIIFNKFVRSFYFVRIIFQNKSH